MKTELLLFVIGGLTLGLWLELGGLGLLLAPALWAGLLMSFEPLWVRSGAPPHVNTPRTDGLTNVVPRTLWAGHSS